MADFKLALEKTLKHEGGFADKSATTGEVVNMGITHWLLRNVGVLDRLPRNIPATPEEIEKVKDLTKEEVSSFYFHFFWISNLLGGVDSQMVAEKIFDLAVNTGSKTAVTRLQTTCNTLTWPGPSLVVDGVMGKKTLAVVNSLGEVELLEEYRNRMTAYYNSLAITHPVLASNLTGWLNRLNS